MWSHNNLPSKMLIDSHTLRRYTVLTIYIGSMHPPRGDGFDGSVPAELLGFGQGSD